MLIGGGKNETSRFCYKRINSFKKWIDVTPIVFDFSKKVELLDYIKGWSILFVILTHCLSRPIRSHLLFCTWGQMAVPLFLLVSTTLFYRYGRPTEINFHIEKLWARIIRPYCIFLLVMVICTLCLGTENIHSVLTKIIHKGGFGPGAYYVPMFVLFSLILPLTSSFLSSYRKMFVLFILFLVISIASIIYLPSNPYRLLPVRYLFLIPLGYIWAIKGICLNKVTMSLSFISFISLIVFHYSHMSFYPFFYTTQPWDYANWICYFWPAFFMPFVFRFLHYRNIVNTNYVFQYLGKRSYEIFILQMAVFYYLRHFGFITSHLPLYVFLSITLSILPVYLYDKVKKRA